MTGEAKPILAWDWRRALVAILLGNIVFFFLLEPALPESFRHVPFRIDLGLALDFVLCAVFYGALLLAKKK
jgi:polyferredoxin